MKIISRIRNSSSGFTLIEVLIAMALLAGGAYAFLQLSENFYRQRNVTVKRSSSKKAGLGIAANLSKVSFDELYATVKRAEAENYKCDNTRRPPEPYVAETMLYDWSSSDSTYKYCLDINKYELKNQDNVLDVELRILVRELRERNHNPKLTRFIVLRRAR